MKIMPYLGDLSLLRRMGEEGVSINIFNAISGSVERKIMPYLGDMSLLRRVDGEGVSINIFIFCE